MCLLFKRHITQRYCPNLWAWDPGIKQSSLIKLPSKPLRKITQAEWFVGLHHYDSQSILFIHVRNGNFYNSISFPDLFLLFPPSLISPFPPAHKWKSWSCPYLTFIERKPPRKNGQEHIKVGHCFCICTQRGKYWQIWVQILPLLLPWPLKNSFVL